MAEQPTAVNMSAANKERREAFIFLSPMMGLIFWRRHPPGWRSNAACRLFLRKD